MTEAIYWGEIDAVGAESVPVNDLWWDDEYVYAQDLLHCQRPYCVNYKYRPANGKYIASERVSKITQMMVFKDGIFHNESGPAVVEFDGSKMIRAVYATNGTLHWEHGPAIVSLEYTGNTVAYYYCLYGRDVGCMIYNKFHEINDIEEAALEPSLFSKVVARKKMNRVLDK